MKTSLTTEQRTRIERIVNQTYDARVAAGQKYEPGLCIAPLMEAGFTPGEVVTALGMGYGWTKAITRTGIANVDAHSKFSAIDAQRRENYATVIDRHSFGSATALLNPLHIARVCRVARRDRSPSLSRIQRGSGPIAIADAFDVAFEDAANAVAVMGVRSLTGHPFGFEVNHRFNRADAFMQQLIHLSDAGAVAIEWPESGQPRATMGVDQFYHVATPILQNGLEQAVIENGAEPFVLRARDASLARSPITNYQEMKHGPGRTLAFYAERDRALGIMRHPAADGLGMSM